MQLPCPAKGPGNCNVTKSAPTAVGATPPLLTTIAVAAAAVAAAAAAAAAAAVPAAAAAAAYPHAPHFAASHALQASHCSGFTDILPDQLTLPISTFHKGDIWWLAPAAARKWAEAGRAASTHHIAVDATHLLHAFTSYTALLP